MGSVAVIFTAYRRWWAYERIAAALAEQRKSAFVYTLYEDPSDLVDLDGAGFRVLPGYILQSVPNGVNPLSAVVNVGLDMADDDDFDYITYLTDDSLPHAEKYHLMAQALDEHPEWGAVYCSQDFGEVRSPEEWLDAGWDGRRIRVAENPEPDPFCRVDHTQVMHRRTTARWPLDPSTAKLSDAYFFRDLVADLGPLMPIPDVLDWTRQLPDGLSKR